MKLVALFASALGLAFVACGGSVEDDGQGGGGSLCKLDPPGESFTFTIRNVGERYLRIAYGCGKSLPIVVEVEGAPLGISPGQADFCEVSCEQVYQGSGNWGCSDCGPGSGAALSPGAERTIVWDRRFYTEHMAPARCSGLEDGNNACALGSLSPADLRSRATLTYCVNDALNPEYADGYCSGVEAQAASFEIDLTQPGVLIELE